MPGSQAAERRGPGDLAGRGPGRDEDPTRGGGRWALRPGMAGARLGRRPRRRRPVGPLRPVTPARRVCRDAGTAKATEQIYPCTCTRADIERASTAPHAEDEGPVYPGTCSGRSVADARDLGERPFAWRFRVPTGRIAWSDLFLGPVELDPRRLGGDFIVARSGHPRRTNSPSCTRRDHGRHAGDPGRRSGAEHPETVLLYRSLGRTPPAFGHVPLAVGPDGRRLAKRDGSIKLATLRHGGVDPRRLVGWLARSCGWADRIVASSPRDWIGCFDLVSLPKAPWVVSSENLAELTFQSK